MPTPEFMTVNDLIEELEALKRLGHGDKPVVQMSDQQSGPQCLNAPEVVTHDMPLGTNHFSGYKAREVVEIWTDWMS